MECIHHTMFADIIRVHAKICIVIDYLNPSWRWVKPFGAVLITFFLYKPKKLWLFFCLFDFIGFFWFWLLFCFILANLQDTFGVWHLLVKGTRRKKAPSNKTLALAKSWNMEIWVVGTSNQLFVRGS